MNIHDKHTIDRLTDQGRWTPEEHELFLQGMLLHGREWKKVQALVRTRTSAQIRSHAQKYFQKMAKTKDGSLASSQSNIGEDAYATLEYMEYIHSTLRRCLGEDPDTNSLEGTDDNIRVDLEFKARPQSHGASQSNRGGHHDDHDGDDDDDDDIGRKSLKRKGDAYDRGSSSDASSVTERTECLSSDDNEMGTSGGKPCAVSSASFKYSRSSNSNEGRAWRPSSTKKQMMIGDLEQTALVALCGSSSSLPLGPGSESDGGGEDKRDGS